MSEVDVELSLRQMLHYADAAMSFAEGRSRADLEIDMQLEFAISRALEVLGEAARRLPGDVVDGHPEIPWRGLIGLRNFLAHGYDFVDLDLLWRTVTEDLGPLRAQIADWLDEASPL
jgi:uncharacterized protein with HEPN domain